MGLNDLVRRGRGGRVMMSRTTPEVDETGKDEGDSLLPMARFTASLAPPSPMAPGRVALDQQIARLLSLGRGKGF